MRMKPATRLRVMVLVGAFALIELLCQTGVIGRFTMIPPSEMATGLVTILASGRVNEDMETTLSSVAIALVSSIAVGLLIHQRSPLSPWLLFGLVPPAIGAFLVF